MSKEGGDLNQMAKDGTSSKFGLHSILRLARMLMCKCIVPGDAGKQNVIPSVPNPDQKSRDASGGIGAAALHSAADNPIGAGKNADDSAISASGHSVPQSTAAKPSGAGGKERQPERFQEH
ncbi:hypothetical protein F5Y05DRAFT_364470 [Hypoxylon sp. FL0543]|nr:hypothetical protein F5Y05DRAFT_364470 [Hypoxylon sp. FL0543]